MYCNKDVFDKIRYQPMQGTSSQDDIVYSLSNGSFPSHIRKVCPKLETHVVVETDDDIIKPPPCCSTRLMYGLLLAIFIVSSSIAVGVAVIEIRAGYKQNFFNEPAISMSMVSYNSTVTEKQTVADVRKPLKYLDEHQKIKTIYTDTRTRCTDRCRAYSRPQFEATCSDGVCTCNGEGYTTDTCLPYYRGCTIRERHNFMSKASIKSKPKPIYACSTRGTSSGDVDIHVISIYGNHFSAATVVNIIGNCRRPVKLVLASHYAINWKLKYDGLEIQEITLVSDWNVNSLTVTLNKNASANQVHTPSLAKLYLPFGYGDDRYTSNTVDMLRSITENIGPVTSFSGTSFADNIILKLCD